MGSLKNLIGITGEQAGKIAECHDDTSLQVALADMIVEQRKKEPAAASASLKECFLYLVLHLKEKHPNLYDKRYRAYTFFTSVLRKAFKAEFFNAVDSSPYFLVRHEIDERNVDSTKAIAFSADASKFPFKGESRTVYRARLCAADSCLRGMRLGPNTFMFFTRKDQITKEAIARKLKESKRQ